VDLEGATVTVRQTVTSSEQGYRPEEDQKSQESARRIDFDRHTVEALAAQSEAHAGTRRAVGSEWNEAGLVFPREDGS
jgi:hypothetical protein